MRGLIEDNSDIYINVHFEQVFNNLFLDCSSAAIKQGTISMGTRGIYQDELSQSTANMIFKELREEKNKVLILDFDRISSVSNNTKDILARGIKDALLFNRIVVINSFGKTNDVILDIYRDINDSSERLVFANEGNECEHYNKKKKEVILNYFKKDIEKCCEEYNQTSPSSKVRLSRYVDIKKMMLNMDRFSFYAYCLGKDLIERGLLHTYDKNDGVRFLVHTINGAVIGTILSQLFGISITKIDHLGPMNELIIKKEDCNIQKNAKYITVSDVICMGREIEAAKTALRIYGAHYLGSICLLSFSPVGGADSNIYSIINVDKNNNFLHYSIETDLCS